MCCRYFVDSASMVEEFDLLDSVRGQGLKRSGEIYPSDTVPVIANSRSLKAAPFAMKWGFSLGDGKLLINVRSETATQKPLFSDSMKNRRCLIPFSFYFEWEKQGKDRIRYAISPNTSAFLAGLYRMENNTPVFSVLTREPADSIRFIHDRMPLILPREMCSDWLNIRYDATQMMNHALLNVTPRRMQPDQLSMFN